MISYQDFKSPYGDLTIASYGDKLCICDWKYRRMRMSINERVRKYYNSEFVEESSIVIEKTIELLNRYFSGEDVEWDIPIELIGTDFQKSVWTQLLKIPYGKTTTYKKLSENMKNEKAIRAVATANGANTHAIIVPCHRVIGSNGDLVGYAGGLRVKKKLLDLESKVFQPSLFECE